MPRSPWVKQNQTSAEEMRRAMEDFKNRGGQVDSYPEGYDPKKLIRSETAISVKDFMSRNKK